MSALKEVTEAIIGTPKSIIVNGRLYPIKPPTIHTIAVAANYLDPIPSDISSFADIVSMMKEMGRVSEALSVFICGDTSLADELSKGEMQEVVEGLAEAIGMISPQNFSMLSGLIKNVAQLIAKPK